MNECWCMDPWGDFRSEPCGEDPCPTREAWLTIEDSELPDADL